MNFTRSFTSFKKNVRRTPYQTLAASMIMFITFLIISIFLILAVGSHVILKYYESRPLAIAFFKDGTTDEDVRLIQDALRQTGKVTKLRYVSQDEALTKYKEDNKEDPRLIELVTASMLPTSLEISTAKPDDLKQIADIVSREPVVESVALPQDAVENMSATIKLIRGVGIGVIIYLSIFATLITIMIIGFKIRIQRVEIETMRLLGASKWFIRLPFVFEGVFYGLMGATLGWIVSLLIFWYLNPFLESFIKEGELLQQLIPIPLSFIVILLFLQILVAMILGILGSYGAVRRYLKI